MEKKWSALLDGVKWKPVQCEDGVGDGSLPHVTHEGTLQVGSMALRVLRLSDGQRIIDAGDLERLFGGAT